MSCLLAMHYTAKAFVLFGFSKWEFRNDHWDDMREKGFVSNRIYDGLASGAFIISDEVQNMGDIEKHICIYKTPDELKKWVEYYLSHPEERSKNIDHAVRFIRNNHTFDHRAKQFSQLINALSFDL